MYELGLKSNFKGGFVNVAVFQESIKGFQSNAYTGIGYALVNAGEESVKGFEIDSAYRPIGMLSLTESVTYLDPKYNSFTHAPCFNFDTVNCPIVNGVMPPFRDLTGKTPAGIPRWSSTTSATLTQDFGVGNAVFLRAEYDYSSTTDVGGDGVPANIGDYDSHIVNASLGFTNGPHRFEDGALGAQPMEQQHRLRGIPNGCTDRQL